MRLGHPRAFHWKLYAGLATDAHGFTRIPDDREMLRGMVCRLDGTFDGVSPRFVDFELLISPPELSS